MKLNRAFDSSNLQRVLAVALSVSLVAGPSAPLFAEGFRAQAAPAIPAIGALPVAPVFSGVPVGPLSVPALNTSALPRLDAGALAPQAVVSPIVAGAVSATAQATAPAQTPASSPVTVLGLLTAQLAPQPGAGAPGAGETAAPSFNKEQQAAVYDHAAKAAGAGETSAAVELEDWTAAPAQIPLATLKPGWQPAEKASAPALVQRYADLEINDPVQEKDVALTEKLAMPSAKSAVKDISADEESMAFGLRERFQAEGARQAVLAGSVMAWIDESGKVVVHDRRDHETVRIEAPMGAATKLAASQDGKSLYVVAGGHLQRWDLDAREAVVIMDEKALGGEILELNAVKGADGKNQGLDVRTPSGHVFWQPGSLGRVASGSEAITAQTGAAPSLREAGDGFYLETRGGSTRLWGRSLTGDGAAVVDLGSVPAELKSVVALADRKTVFGLTDNGFIEWDLVTGRFRRFPVNGLRSALGARGSIDVSPDGRRVLVAAGEQLFFADLGATPRGVEAAEADTRQWSDEHPMFIKDGQLHIGAFTFAVTPRYEAPAPERWYQKLWRRITRQPAPQGKMVPPVTREQWAALNLPANKKALYQTLKGFALGQNVLYIGETGGGKTWMSTMISKLIGRKLYMVSFTEYTKNQDLLFSRTFGEEGKGKTGKTLETVLQWLDDKEGGILLLDEMHKPLEGIAALNNVLQNLSYHFNGRDIRGDKATHFVIGTMNPVKPPYKGEPPSGELSSRFGTTVQVNYLPPAEEAALLSIFFPGSPDEINRKLVAIAKELRKIYPDILPLPISSRTLLYIAEHIARFPGDDAVEIFKTTYNPGTIVEDPSIVEAIDKALRAHDLAGAKAKKG
jgi:MoxR-like ATPase